MIQDGQADIKSVSDRGIFAGGKFNNLVPFMSEKRTGELNENQFQYVLLNIIYVYLKLSHLWFYEWEICHMSASRNQP